MVICNPGMSTIIESLLYTVIYATLTQHNDNEVLHTAWKTVNRHTVMLLKLQQSNLSVLPCCHIETSLY